MSNFYIKTYGCQMNELDSEYLATLLEGAGYRQANSLEKADIVIFNTCSVRDLAERKTLGKIGLLKKKKTPQIIGICGCMAMAKKGELLKKFPHLDFVLGVNNINDIVPTVQKALRKQKSIKTEDKVEDLDFSKIKRKSKIKAFVSIIRGCNNFCSYCIVPYLRGREISRDPKAIILECKKLIEKGYKEITLLGQNVNSFGKDRKENFFFSDLLYELDKLPGEKRIRFLTSHPKDITLDLMQAINELQSVCEYVHFPLQAGSNKILKRMNRKYTLEEYLEKVSLLQNTIKRVSLGTDIIVGFPEETEEDFLKTHWVLKKVKFYQAYIFAYSPRKNTAAYNFPETVCKEEKNRRLNSLLNLHNAIVQEENQKKVGQVIEVLVEGMNKEFLKGRGRLLEKVIFKGRKEQIGSFQKVKIESCIHHTLIGTTT